MKEKFLIASASLVGLATVVGVSATAFVESAQQAARLGTAGGILALGSVGLFMISLATPKT
jgi:hypothetical protein